MFNTTKYRFSSGKAVSFISLVLLLSVQISMAQWVQMSNGMGVQSVAALVSSGNIIFAGTYGAGVFKTTDNGTNWTQTPLNNITVYSLAVNGNNIFAGTYGYGVSLSTDNGNSWVQTSLNYVNVFALTINGNYIFAGTSNFGIFVSSDNGTAWVQTSLNNRTVYSLAKSGNNIYAGCELYGVNLSTDNGQSWTQTSMINRSVYSLAVYGNNIFAGTGSTFGVYLSTNNGTSWTQTSLNNKDIRSLAVSGNNVIAGTFNNFGIYVSNDNGSTWVTRNEGLPLTTISALCIAGSYIFAGPFSNSVYRRPLGELVGLHQYSNEIPKEYSLSQNYPNPFNPSTKIMFDIPSVGNGRDRSVLIIIYDISGRLIETLVNENLNPGTYEVEWNAAKYSSGVYFYRLIAGDYSAAKKMMLVK